MRDPNSGFVVDDKLIVSARVRVEPQVNWWNWDSKKETGYVGLKNQGATCYINSLLQTLAHIPYFRRAVYHMQTSIEDDPEKSIPLALQVSSFPCRRVLSPLALALNQGSVRAAYLLQVAVRRHKREHEAAHQEFRLGHVRYVHAA